MNLRGKLAFITGATAGIGLATAEALADQNCNLILTGRRADRLKALSERLSKKVNVQTLSFDVSDREASEALFNANKQLLADVDILINNAGFALGTESVSEGKIDDWEAMLDTNVKGLLRVTRWLLPYLLKKNSADIVNLGSVAGRWVYPGGAVYCATKHAVRVFTEGLRMDLMGTNIRVINIEPGMVETEFSLVRLGSAEKAKSVYAGMTPLVANDIAETIVWCLSRPQHVNIQELVIFPTDQAAVGQVRRRRDPNAK